MSVKNNVTKTSVKRILWIRIARHFMVLALSVTMIFISLAHCSNTERRILAVSIICKTSSWSILRPKLVKSLVGLYFFVQTLLPKATDPYDCSQALLFCDLQSVIKRNVFAVHKYIYDLFYYERFANTMGYWDCICERWIYINVFFSKITLLKITLRYCSSGFLYDF